jgi:hypothetical protein
MLAPKSLQRGVDSCALFINIHLFCLPGASSSSIAADSAVDLALFALLIVVVDFWCQIISLLMHSRYASKQQGIQQLLLEDARGRREYVKACIVCVCDRYYNHYYAATATTYVHCYIHTVFCIHACEAVLQLGYLFTPLSCQHSSHTLLPPLFSIVHHLQGHSELCVTTAAAASCLGVSSSLLILSATASFFGLLST